jgi:hypothetical protein
MGGRLKLWGVLIGLAGNVLVALALYHLLQTGSCGGAGTPPCPDEIVPWIAALPVGILVSILGIFVGGGAVSFAGLFLAVGLGAIAAAAFGTGKGEMATFGWWFGGMFLLFGLAPLVIGAVLRPLAAAKQAKAMKLIATGRQGVGTIVEVRDTGITINDNPRVEILMRIEPADGGPPFVRTKTETVSRVAVPKAGERFPVWYDPADADDWVFGVEAEANAPSEIKAAFARAAAAPHQAIDEERAPSPLDEIARLNELRLSGALTEREFADAKAVLLARLG